MILSSISKNTSSVNPSEHIEIYTVVASFTIALKIDIFTTILSRSCVIKKWAGQVKKVSGSRAKPKGKAHQTLEPI